MLDPGILHDHLRENRMYASQLSADVRHRVAEAQDRADVHHKLDMINEKLDRILKHLGLTA